MGVRERVLMIPFDHDTPTAWSRGSLVAQPLVVFPDYLSKLVLVPRQYSVRLANETHLQVGRVFVLAAWEREHCPGPGMYD